MENNEFSIGDVLFICFFWLILLAYVLAVLGYGVYEYVREGLRRVKSL